MQQVDGKLECGGVFVAEDADPLAVLGDHLQVEGLHGHIPPHPTAASPGWTWTRPATWPSHGR